MATRRPLCTVLAPFDLAGQARFEAIKRMADGLGLEAMRVAQYYSSGMILEEIVRSIWDAEIVVADVSADNPNVHYELGVAHALGKRVFTVAEGGCDAAINFGTATPILLEASDAGLRQVAQAMALFVATPGMTSPVELQVNGRAVATPATWGRRMVALAVDTLLALAATMILTSCLALTMGRPAAGLPASLGAAAFWITLFGCSLLLPRSPGMRLTGLRVLRLDRQPPHRLHRCVRTCLAFCTLGLGFLRSLKGPAHQSHHDFVTRTIVVRQD